MKRQIKIYYIIWNLLFIGYGLQAQVNLVMNPSFEELMACPTSCCQADTVKYWSWINNTTFLPPNYLNCKASVYSSCANYSTQCSVPYNWNTYQYPKTGNSYTGFASIYADPPSYLSNKREYLKGELTETLQVGKIYCLTFYYNADNNIINATNRFGAYIDNGSIASYGCCKDMPITPQAQNNPSVFMTDTLNWVKIQNSFTAIGNENTITLGNFVDSATIQFQLFNNNGIHAPYYNIDDVSLIPMDLPAYAGRDTSITHGDSTYIGRANEIGLNDDCFWHILENTTPIDTVAGMWVRPNTTTSYVVEQNICGTVTYDTVMVSVVLTGIKQFISNTAQLKIYPNPANEIINITVSETQGEIKISDVLGNEITRETIKNNLQVDISSYSKGIYFVEFFTGNKAYTGKFIKD